MLKPVYHKIPVVNQPLAYILDLANLYENYRHRRNGASTAYFETNLMCWKSEGEYRKNVSKPTGRLSIVHIKLLIHSDSVQLIFPEGFSPTIGLLDIGVSIHKQTEIWNVFQTDIHHTYESRSLLFTATGKEAAIALLAQMVSGSRGDKDLWLTRQDRQQLRDFKMTKGFKGDNEFVIEQQWTNDISPHLPKE